jgi:CTP:molybdopterin cytidylyltransferase MocA
VDVVAVVLAAGRGVRMGGPKALLTLEGETFLARVTRLIDRPGVSAVVAVLGDDAEDVAARSGLAAGVAVVRNPRPADGMLSSLCCGLDAAEARGGSAVLVHPVDHPLVDAATVDRVLQALAEGATIAVPSHDGRRGHPGGFSRAAWPALRAADPARGARCVLADHPDCIGHVAGDAGSVRGINDPEDYRRLRDG